MSKNNGNNDDKKKEEQNCVYMLYEKKNNNNKKVQYIGRTNNLERRKNEHQRNPYRAHLDFSKIECYPTKREARIYEQVYIEKYKTLNKGNKMNNQINSISPKSQLYKLEVVPRIHGGYFDESYVGGKEWD